MPVSMTMEGLPDVSVSLGDVRLVIPDDTLLTALSSLVHGGIHDANRMPFTVPWTARAPDTAAEFYVDWVRRRLAESTPDSWTLCFAVLKSDVVVGAKSLHATGFPRRRVVETGSWLGREFQGLGIGTTMRIAVLDLAFDHLHATSAVSEAFADNSASRRLNERLGYRLERTSTVARVGADAVLNHYRMARVDWLNQPRPSMADVHGPQGWANWFGAAPQAN